MRYFIFLSLVLLSLDSSAIRYYVRANASGNGNGLSWQTAFNNLEQALALATDGDEVWVAEGTYVPGNGASRESTFLIPGGVAVFGGFAGGETSLGQRNLLENLTVLSGERGTSGLEDNVATIVTFSAMQHAVLIDGFLIERGYSDLVINRAAGIDGGVNNGYTIRNCIFKDNTKDASGFPGSGLNGNGGGAIRSAHSTSGPIIIERCYFLNNRDLSSDGGAINISEAAGGANLLGGSVGNITINRCFFKDNYAERFGGAVSLVIDGNVESPMAIFTNSVFEGNQCGLQGNYPAIRFNLNVRIEHCTTFNNARIPQSSFQDLTQPIGHFPSTTNSCEIYNCVLYGNANNQTGFGAFGSGTVILDNNFFFNGFSQNLVGGNVSFVNANSGDLRLLPSSAGINAANPSLTTVSTDFFGRPRSLLGAPDIGAFELENTKKPVVYVREGGSLLSTGFTWSSALPNPLMDISPNTDGIQVWISEGIYPTAKQGPGGSTIVYDQICNDCDYIGGFAGNETDIEDADFNRETIITGAPAGLAPTSVRVKLTSNNGRSILRNLIFEDNTEQATTASAVIETENLERLSIEYCTIRSCASRTNAVALFSSNTDTVIVSHCRFLDNGTAGLTPQPQLIRLTGLNDFTMESSIVSGNQHIEGALFTDSGGSSVIDCLFENNSCSHFVAMHTTPQVSDQRTSAYERCSFLGNDFVALDQVIPAILKTSKLQLAQVQNSLFGNNNFNTFGDFEASSVTLRNITVSNFTGAQSKLIAARRPSGTPASGTFTLTNSILVSDALEGGVFDILSSHFGTFVAASLATNPNSIGTPTVSNLITSDPVFVDPSVNNFRLASWSPLINAGSNTFAQGMAGDLSNGLRIADGTVDLGAYERVGGCFPDNNECLDATPIELNASISGSNRCAVIGSDPISSCNVNVGKTVWYAFEAPSSGQVQVITSDILPAPGYTQFNMKQTIYTGPCGNLTEVACTNEFIAGFGETTDLSGLTPGQVYYIRIEGVNQQEGFYDLLVSSSATTDCVGDFNDDQTVNSTDLLIFLAAFGSTCNGCNTDLDGDNNVAVSDLLIFLSAFGQVCN